MNFWIFKAKKIIITTIIFEFFIFNLLFILSPLKSTNFSLIELLNIFFISTLLFYISGKYHELYLISKLKLIKNFIKVLITILITLVFYNFLYPNFNSSIFLTLNLISISLYIIFIIINQIVINNFFRNLNKYQKKWIVYKDDSFKTFLEKNLLPHEKKLYSNFLFINNIDELKKTKIFLKNNIKGIIINIDNQLNQNLNNDLLNSKIKNLEKISQIDWTLRYLNRIPPSLIKKDNIKRFSDMNNKFAGYKVKIFSEILLSCLLLIFSLPITLVSAIFIYLEDKGPIFYFQYRTGERGKRIKICKLRTMKINAEKDGAQWSSKNDKRITKIGSILRKTRIDEIPQLLSVLRGDMSLIGPRPERPEIELLLKEKIDNYNLKYLVKPGLSGWAQVNYTYGSSIYDSKNKLSYDIFYIFKRSIIFDFLIMIKTIKTVFKMELSIAKN